MSKHKQRGWGAPDFSGMIAGLVVFGAVIGAGVTLLLTVVLPWVWTWLKPLIHGWTA